jgi:competence protein ComEC
LGVVIGVIAAMSLPYGLFSGIGWLLVGIVLLAPLANVRQAWILLIVVISGVFVGLWRGGVGQIGLDQYDNLIGRQVVICGVISEDPDVDKRGQTVLRVSDISVQGRELPGNVWVVTPKNDVLRRSDAVTVSGKMTEGFGAFAGAIYRAEIVTVERAVPGDVAVNVRDWFSERVRAHVPAPEVDLGLGYLLGLRRALPADLAEALKIAGLTHVIVASGYNLTILVRLSRRLFVRISKYLSMLSSVGMILAFMAVTGLSPSMSRAGLVAGLSLATWYYGRTIHPFVLLSFSAAITLLINPQFGWNDLGCRCTTD